jgi:hypothetical protein
VSSDSGIPISCFHEAAHAVAAIETLMIGISVRVTRGVSAREVKTDADISFACPMIFDEPLWRLLQRKLVVILAGADWDVEMSTNREGLSTHALRRMILRDQKDDRLAAVAIIRDLRLLCGLRGRELRLRIESAWSEVRMTRHRKEYHLTTIAETLQRLTVLDDSLLRALYATVSIDHPGDANNKSGENLGDVR